MKDIFLEPDKMHPNALIRLEAQAPPPPHTHTNWHTDTAGWQMSAEIWASVLAGMAQTPTTARWGPVSSRPCGYHSDLSLHPSAPLAELESCEGGCLGGIWRSVCWWCVRAYICVNCHYRTFKRPRRLSGCSRVAIKHAQRHRGV